MKLTLLTLLALLFVGTELFLPPETAPTARATVEGVMAPPPEYQAGPPPSIGTDEGVSHTKRHGGIPTEYKWAILADITVDVARPLVVRLFSGAYVLILAGAALQFTKIAKWLTAKSLSRKPRKTKSRRRPVQRRRRNATK